MPVTYYRLCRSHPPTVADFMSDAEKGRRPRGAQMSNPVLYYGISVFDSLDALYDTAAEVPLHGAIIEVTIPDGSRVEAHKTGRPGHWTLVGDAIVLLRFAGNCKGVL